MRHVSIWILIKKYFNSYTTEFSNKWCFSFFLRDIINFNWERGTMGIEHKLNIIIIEQLLYSEVYEINMYFLRPIYICRLAGTRAVNVSSR